MEEQLVELEGAEVCRRSWLKEKELEGASSLIKDHQHQVSFFFSFIFTSFYKFIFNFFLFTCHVVE